MQLTLELPIVNAHTIPPRLRAMTRETAPPMAGGPRTRPIKPEALAKMLTRSSTPNDASGGLLLIDSRSFLEYNVDHISRAVNVTCSKLVKRRLQQNKLTIKELLASSCKLDADSEAASEVVVYDQGTADVACLTSDNFLGVLLGKLNEVFKSVSLLTGGYTSFQSCFPYLCESENRPPCPARAPLSHPCLPVANTGPTRVLGFLYLGSQQDVMSEECLKRNGIDYVLNVSRSCPVPEFLPQTHIHRIPVRDSHSEKILPWFDEALEFIDKVKSANGSVIVHCLAGISRSPTVAIAFIMRYLNMNVDEAYKYVKEKRATISPNFNFLGQLLEYEKMLRSRKAVPSGLGSSAPPKEGMDASEGKERTEGARGSSIGSGSAPTVAPIPQRVGEEHSRPAPIPVLAPSPAPRRVGDDPLMPQPLKPHSRKLSLENLTLPLKCSYSPGRAAPRSGRTLPRVTFASEDGPASATAPPSVSLETGKSIKRSLSRDALTEVGTQTLLAPEKRSTSHLTLDLKGAPARTTPRPTGLDVKKVALRLDSPGESKKPRSLCNSPSGLLEQLAWGTSHLSVHSPEVRGGRNPFVEACAKFQAQQQTAAAAAASGGSGVAERLRSDAMTTAAPGRVERTKLKLEGLVSNSEAIRAEIQRQHPMESLAPVASDASALTTPISPVMTRGQRHNASETSVGFQFGSSRISQSDVSRASTKSTNSCHHQSRDQPKPSALKKPTFGPQNSPPPIIPSAASLSACASISNPLFSRQSSAQSATSDLSLGSVASPPVADSSASSWMTPRGSLSSGISPDVHLSSACSSAPGSANPSRPDPPSSSSRGVEQETPQALPSGWNPFSFPQARGDDSPAGRGEAVVWQRRRESGDDSSHASPRPHQSPTTAMDRVATYITRCNFGSPDASDSESPEPGHAGPRTAGKQQCNSSSSSSSKRRPKLQPSVRSQSCEEIGSTCSREVAAVTSEIVSGSRRDILDFGRAALDQEEEDFDTRSLSSQRSLSSSCEMIEVS